MSLVAVTYQLEVSNNSSQGRALNHKHTSCYVPKTFGYMASLLGHCHILNFVNSKKGDYFWTNLIMTCKLVEIVHYPAVISHTGMWYILFSTRAWWYVIFFSKTVWY